MATPPPQYRLEGTFLLACSCAGPCPCAVGWDPDNGHCEAIYAYHVRQGDVQGIDVSGLSIVRVDQIPGNVLAGHWREVLLIDEQATAPQRDAIVAAFSGKLGGPLADLAALVEDRVAVYSVPVQYSRQAGESALRVVVGAVARAAGVSTIPPGPGALQAGTKVSAKIETARDAQGRPTVLENSRFSVNPGSPVELGLATEYRVDLPDENMVWDFTGRNGMQGEFRFEG
jgi:hypothetical protein